MFEPPVAASFTTAVRSNGLPATGFGGDVATLVTTGGWTSVSVAVKTANVSFAPVALSTARASTCCGPERPRVQRSWAMPSPPVIAAPAKTLPPPATTTKLTICPFTAWLRESSTSATSGFGNSVPGGPLWLLPDTTDSESGPTGWPVSTTVLHEGSTRSPASRASGSALGARVLGLPEARNDFEIVIAGGGIAGYETTGISGMLGKQSRELADDIRPEMWDRLGELVAERGRTKRLRKG